MADAGIVDTQEFHCPQCGYDLRGVGSDRCPECGLAIDRADTTSRLPWSHRTSRGRMRAYVATVWIVIARPRLLRAEFARPVSLGDARRFWTVTSILLCVPTLGLAGYVAYAVVETQYFRAWAAFGWGMPQSVMVRRAVWELGLPTVAGWMATPLTAALLIVTTFAVGRVLPCLVNSPAIAPVRRARAVALAHYCFAPMLILPTVALLLFLVAAAFILNFNRAGDPFDPALAWCVGLSFGATMLALWARTAGFYRVAFFGGVGRASAGLVLATAGWVIVTLFWLVAVPWAVGAGWLLWRGTR